MLMPLRPNRKIVRTLEQQDSLIDDLSLKEIKKKNLSFTQRERKLSLFIEPKSISAKIKTILTKQKHARVKAHLARIAARQLKRMRKTQK